MIKILDCTLRDGGFYTQWDFSTSFVQAYCQAMDAAGVDYIELGYRSLVKSEFSGAYRFTSESTLEKIPALKHSKIVVMLDSKEFAANPESVKEIFLPAAHSKIEMVRVATKFKDLSASVEMVNFLKEMGYETTINQMAWATLSDDEQNQAIDLIQSANVDAFYIADSFGGMYPEDIRDAAEKLNGKIPMAWGVHLHNNLELAFANAMTGMEHGAVFVDSSVLGMGRGPGNLRTEIFLQFLEKRRQQEGCKTTPVIDFISRFMVDMKAQYQWGPQAPYVLSGALSVHPTYAQKLMGTGRYTVQEVASILEAIDRNGSGAGYKEAELTKAISDRFSNDDVAGQTVQLPDSKGGLSSIDASSEVLVIGRGPSVGKHLDAINEYIERYDPIVLECNYLPSIRKASRHYSCFVLLANAIEMVPDALKSQRKILLGFEPTGTLSSLAQQNIETLKINPYRVERNELQFVEDCVIPHDVVSMFAIVNSLKAGARKFLLVGFDGYKESGDKRRLRLQTEMNNFFNLLEQNVPQAKAVSLLPSSYDVSQSSIYYHLFHEAQRP